MGSDPHCGAEISGEKEIGKAILNFLKNILDQKLIDGLLMPVMVPSGDSYAWILMKDSTLVDQANPLAPVMPVQGAKALKSLTRKGKSNMTIAAVMRPCEVKAAVELTKLSQVNLDHIVLFSYDCPGAIPLEVYSQDPAGEESHFQSMIDEKQFEDEGVKPVCQICTDFSVPASDLHFALAGEEGLKPVIVSCSEKGSGLLEKMGLKTSHDLTPWENRVEEIRKAKTKKKEEVYKTVQHMVEGFDNLLDTFSNCIGCHNCQSACPICYCRQCYFDSKEAKPEAYFLLEQAEKRGGISFPKDKIMFHVGRMSHMSLSCVSCGLCSDACPVSIPVARIFSYVAAQTQKAFEYNAGRTAGEALPMKEYKMDELKEIHEMIKNAESVGAPHE
jgi:formate dehydrogenase subunit beta